MVVTRDVAHQARGLVQREVVGHGGGQVVGGGAVGVLYALAYLRVVREVPANLGVGLVAGEHAYLRLGGVVVQGERAAHLLHQLFLVLVGHPHHKVALCGAGLKRVHNAGDARAA